jgi:hypothetical protein
MTEGSGSQQADQTPPCWLRIWATDVMPNDLVRFRPGTDAVRIIDRTYPSAISSSFTVTLPGGETAGVMKMAKIEIFDPDGTVGRRVQMVLPPLADPR